ncbi:LysR family transcriptional regulator [Acetobacteraceae bacterium H6797]|nr:LysR family transcriptional regulator [Acetobacteraceae bacterium H6797]
MTLRQLEILRAVIRCQTTIAAAQQLGMSQPAVSNAIRQMESQLGFPLFERLNNRLFPTDGAAIIYEESEPLFAMHSALEVRVQELREDKITRLRILSTPPLGHGVIPSVMVPFSRRHPRLQIYFDIRELDEVVRSVESGKTDIGFGLSLGAQPTLEMEALFRGVMVCALPPRHPLAGQESVSLQALQADRFIALDAHTTMGAAVRDAYQEAKLPMNFAVEVKYCNTACILAEAGMGAAIVDPFSATMPRRNLSIRPLDTAIPCTAWVFWSARRPLSEIASRFVKEVRLAVAAAMQPAPA